jgi:hypothetical protein
MPSQIVSGGQTGVDRAALEVALELGIPCGGWCPRGRLAEDGPIPSKYPLQETPSEVYAQRTEWNVRDSDGTLVLTRGRPSEGTAFTIEMAARLKKPYLVIDLGLVSSPLLGAGQGEGPRLDQDVRSVALSWITQHDIRILNVAGPRESKCPGIYKETMKFLRIALGGLR